MDEANKAVELGIEDGKFKVSVDPNKDGQPVLVLLLDIAEVPDEVAALFSRKSE